MPAYRFKKGYIPHNKGKKLTLEQKEKVILNLTGGGWNKGKKLTEEHKNKLRGKRPNVKPWNKGTKGLIVAWNKGKKLTQEHKQKLKENHWNNKGKNNPNWIEDRTKLITYGNSEERRSPKYKDWRRQICNRDNWKCKMNNKDCNGRLEVHHILGFTDYPELKYDINNGICLCHFHHPRVRKEEKRLSPYFMELVSVSKK